MPVTPLTSDQVRDNILRDRKNLQPEADVSSDSDNYVRASATGSAVEGLYQHQQWAVAQIFADTADSDMLLRHARLRGMDLKPAVIASGTVRITGAAGGPVASGLAAKYEDGTAYITTAGVRIRKVADGNPRAPIGGFVFERIKLESGGTPSTYSQEANFTQSTETIPGSAKIATQALTNAGVDDATVVTPKKLRAGFAFSVGAIGYIAFPTWLGGLIIQWGQAACAAGTTSSTTFPLAFPTLCLNVVACGYQATGNTQSYTTVNSRSATSFGWSGFLAAGGSAPVLAATAGSVVAWWIAIGY